MALTDLLAFRLSSAERESLAQLAAERGTSLSGALRHLIATARDTSTEGATIEPYKEEAETSGCLIGGHKRKTTSPTRLMATTPHRLSDCRTVARRCECSQAPQPSRPIREGSCSAGLLGNYKMDWYSVQLSSDNQASVPFDSC